MKDFSEKSEEQLTQTKNDVKYLREYIAFGSSGPVIIGECFYKALLNAHEKNEFETVAHLQLRLHAEMVMCLETFGAMLRAFSLWDKPDGILGALLHYKPGDIPKFMEELNTSNDTLRLLCFPTKDDLLAHGFLTSNEFRIKVSENCRMYLNENIRSAYNKIKHAGMWIRHPEIFNPPSGNKIVTEDVFLINEIAKDGAIECTPFRVYGGNGIAMADKYLNNIRQITNESKEFADLAAYCLENNLMLPSQ